MIARILPSLRRSFLIFVGVITIVVLGFLLWPSPIDPLPYEPAPGAPLTGPLAPNSALTEAELLGDGRLNIPEDVAFDSEGRLYTATGDGRLLRLTREAGSAERVEMVAELGGHPLGLIVGPNDVLYVANHGVGLQAVEPDGTVRLLADRFGERPILFADDLDVSREGVVYFSDASSRFNNTTLDTGPPYLPLDLLEGRPHGALYAYDTRTGEIRLLLGDLYFANGVALTSAEDAVLVVETARHRVRRLWLEGPRAGETDILIGDVPGLADGITSDRRGYLYVTLQTLRTPLFDTFLAPRPWAKALAAKVPRGILRRSGGRYGLVVVYDEAGQPVASLHDPEGQTAFSVANAVPHEGRLYLGSLGNDAIAVVPNPVAGDAAIIK